LSCSRYPPGGVLEVYARLKEVQEAKDCRMGFGRYEAAAMDQAASLEDLWHVLICQIVPMRGVVGIFPCLVLDDQSLESLPEHVLEFAGMRT
jgi:hypothetical protein